MLKKLEPFFPSPMLMRVTLALALFSIVCLVLVGYRMTVTDSRLFAFLVWNLFLAWIPFGMGLLIQRSVKKNALGWFLFLSLGFLWLIFFPNSAYILTDLLHLKTRPEIPLWFDTLMLLSFAINGLFLGLLSLVMIHQTAERLMGKWLGWGLVSASIGLSSFGIYIGRFLRWNSWDLFSSPEPILLDFADRFLHPMSHPRTWGMTLVLTAVFFSAYLVIRFLQGSEPTMASQPSRPLPQ